MKNIVKESVKLFLVCLAVSLVFFFVLRTSGVFAVHMFIYLLTFVLVFKLLKNQEIRLMQKILLAVVAGGILSLAMVGLHGIGREFYTYVVTLLAGLVAFAAENIVKRMIRKNP